MLSPHPTRSRKEARPLLCAGFGVALDLEAGTWLEATGMPAYREGSTVKAGSLRRQGSDGGHTVGSEIRLVKVWVCCRVRETGNIIRILIRCLAACLAAVSGVFVWRIYIFSAVFLQACRLFSQ